MGPGVSASLLSAFSVGCGVGVLFYEGKYMLSVVQQAEQQPVSYNTDCCSPRFVQLI